MGQGGTRRAGSSSVCSLQRTQKVRFLDQWVLQLSQVLPGRQRRGVNASRCGFHSELAPSSSHVGLKWGSTELSRAVITDIPPLRRWESIYVGMKDIAKLLALAAPYGHSGVP